MDQEYIDTVAQRLDRLERENRWWRVIACAAVGVLGFVMLTGATGSKVADEVKARKFIVVDKKGTKRGEFGMVAEGVMPLMPLGYIHLALFDKKYGVMRSTMALVGDDSPHLYLNGKDGQIYMEIEVDGSPRLTIQNNNGAKAILGQTKLMASQTGVVVEHRPASSLVLINKDGKVIWEAP